MALRKGDIVRFYGPRGKYTVMAVRENFVALEQPGQRYTIIDWRNGVRGTHNWMFFVADADETYYEEMLASCETEEHPIAVRGASLIDIDWVERDGVRTQAGIYAESVWEFNPLTSRFEFAYGV